MKRTIAILLLSAVSMFGFGTLVKSLSVLDFYKNQIQSNEKEIKELKAEIEEYKKEQDIILDCVLSGKW